MVNKRNKRDKARLGMTLCKREQRAECRRCPYREPEWDGAWEDEDGRSCWDELTEDVIELLDIARAGSPARLLTFEEIQAAPDLTVLYEEVCMDWGDAAESPTGERIETEIAPVEKRGQQLIGSGLNQEIKEDMFRNGGDVQLRYWSARPTEEQRENTPWEGIGG